MFVLADYDIISILLQGITVFINFQNHNPP